ncbi:hypothetical protein QBC44DRAFT_400165 [Cladorrhinum sp. PSN332]|nr:hypothetical protein QBC44DRAFT_400165 [Cladorrhinum sp. PSN332]
MLLPLLTFLWPLAVVAQNCVSISGGCDGGHSHDEAVSKAIDKFALGSYYGGDSGDPVVFGSGVNNGAAAFISYSCTDGSTPPPVDAIRLRNIVESIATECPNQCGSAALDGACGVALMVVDAAESEDCFNGVMTAGPGDGDCCSPPLPDDQVKDLVDILLDDWLDLADDMRHWLEDLEAHRVSSRLPSIARRLFSLFRRVSQLIARIRLHPTALTLQLLPLLTDLLNAIGPIKRLIPLITAINALDIARAIVLGGPYDNELLLALSALLELFDPIMSLLPPGGEAITTPGVPSRTSSASSGSPSAITSAWYPTDIIIITVLPTASFISTTRTSSSLPSSTSAAACNICELILLAHSGVARRSAAAVMHDADKDLEHPVEKRAANLTRRGYTINNVATYGGSQPPVPICAGDDAQFIFTLESGPYPSTAGQPRNAEDDDADNVRDPEFENPNSAPNIAGIGKLPGLLPTANGPYIDGQYSDTGACSVTLGTFQQPDPQASYHTEHVFERHIVKDFFAWLVHNGHASCRELYRGFADASSHGEYDQAQWTIGDEVMRQLAWYDPRRVETSLARLMHLEEFFVLEGQLNLYKGKIMNGRPLHEAESTSRIIPRPNSWASCVRILDDVALVMSYLNQEPVIKAFRNPAIRVRDYLYKNRQVIGRDYSGLWSQFIGLWVERKQTDLTAWHDQQKPICIQYLRDYIVNLNGACSPNSDFSPFFVARWPSDAFKFPHY